VNVSMTPGALRGATHIVRNSLLAAAGVTLLVGTAACSDGSKNSGSSDRKTAAQAACYEEVKKKLTAPETAQFSQEKAESTNFGYKISGAVETKDGGTSIKNQYLCSVEQNGSEWMAVQVLVTPA